MYVRVRLRNRVSARVGVRVWASARFRVWAIAHLDANDDDRSVLLCAVDHARPARKVVGVGRVASADTVAGGASRRVDVLELCGRVDVRCRSVNVVVVVHQCRLAQLDRRAWAALLHDLDRSERRHARPAAGGLE